MYMLIIIKYAFFEEVKFSALLYTSPLEVVKVQVSLQCNRIMIKRK